jgi:hypothetical protein
MPNRVRIFPYAESPNMRNIRDLAGLWSLLVENTEFRPREGDTIINWGRSSFPEGFIKPGVVVINDPNNVAVAISKLKSLTKLKEAGIRVPEFTTDSEAARRWLSDGHTVLARTLDRGFGGRGIQVVNQGGDLPRAGLYSQYRPKRHEYRVHVWNGEVLDVQQKKKRRDFSGDPDKFIRSYANGWVYCRDGVEAPEAVVQIGLRAVNALGLYFGACDIGVNPSSSRGPTVYEVNTAPGVENTTARKYAQKFASLVRR